MSVIAEAERSINIVAFIKIYKMETTFEPDQELLAFAETFSENWNIIGPGDYVSPGDKKYHIKYVDRITVDGEEKTTNILVENPSGMIVISRDKLRKLETNDDYIFFMVIWCIIQREILDTEKSDIRTMEYYLTTGRLPKNVMTGYISLFSSGDNDVTRERIQALIDFVNKNKK